MKYQQHTNTTVKYVYTYNDTKNVDGISRVKHFKNLVQRHSTSENGIVDKRRKKIETKIFFNVLHNFE